MQIQFVFIENFVQTNFSVRVSKILLAMKNVDKHDQRKFLNRSQCTLFFSCKVTFLNSQINDVTWMFQRSCDEFSFDSKRIKNSSIAKIVREFNFIQTYEKILINVMNMSKIYIELFFFNFYCFHLSRQKDFYKFAMCIKSFDVVLHQWAEAIWQFSNLTLIIIYDEKSVNSKLFSNWINVIAMREISKKYINWSKYLKYIFDKTNRKVVLTIILIFYDIFAFRTLIVKRKIIDDKNKKIFESRWTDIIHILLFDESHKLRKFKINIFQIVKIFKANVMWFLTVIFVINISLIWKWIVISSEYSRFIDFIVISHLTEFDEKRKNVAMIIKKCERLFSQFRRDRLIVIYKFQTSNISEFQAMSK